MNEIEVIVTGPEEAFNYEAEFWCANQLMGVTDTTSLVHALTEADERLASY